MSDINNKIEELGRAFDEFKSANDQRLAEVESKGSADVVTTEKVDRINDQLSELQAEIENLSKKSGRIGATEEEAKADEYSKKFNDFIRYGDNERELKSMSTEGAGGDVVVPKVVDANIIKALRDTSAMRQLARVISVATTDVSFLRSDSATASGWVGEIDPRPETDTPAITKFAPTFGILYANPAASQVSLEDGVFNVEQFLAEELAATFNEAEGAAFINGDGVNKPTGLLAAGTGIASVNAAGTALDSDDLLSLVYALKSAHRVGASFIGNSATWAAVRKLKDNNGQYLWSPSLQVGQPGTLLGYAGYEDDNMGDVAAAATPLAFGNYQKGYMIVDRVGTTIMRDPFTNKPYVHFYATKRVGGGVLNPEAIKLLKMAGA